MNTFTYQEPFETIQRLKAIQTKVMNDPRLSEIGKREEKTRTEKQRLAVYDQLVKALRIDWANIKVEYKTWTREREAAADRSAKGWDFARLEYNRTAARDFIERASLRAIEKRFAETELSGDRHALRAFAEVGRDVMENRTFSDSDAPQAVELKNGFEKMYSDLITTAEQRENAKQGEALTDKISELHQATENARREFSGFSVFGDPNNPFDQMTKGVQVSQRVDPKTLATITSVNLDPETWV